MVGKLTDFTDLASPNAATSNLSPTRYPVLEAETQGLPPKKKRRTSPGQENEKVRGTLGNLEWFDKKDNQWKPAGYHNDYRAELLALAAQQPGAPRKLSKPQQLALALIKLAYSEDMGTDHTSFNILTQGWNEDHTSVIDSRGRRVFDLKKRPADWIRRAKYGPLTHNGRVMLDCKDNPVRDVPGLPLTLSTRAPAWLLAGLRRCIDFTIDDLMARRPNTRETLTGTKQNKWQTCLTQSMTRWLILKNIEPWDTRKKTKRKRQRVGTTNLDDQEHEAVGGRQYMHPGLDLDILNRDSSSLDPYSSSNGSNEQEETPSFLGYEQQGTKSPMLGGDDQQISCGPNLGDQLPFSFDPYAHLPTMACPPIVPQQSTEYYIEDHDQPQSYGGLTFSAFGTSSAGDILGTQGISSNTGYGLFDSGEVVGDIID